MPTVTIGENTGDDYGGSSYDTRIRGAGETTNYGSDTSFAIMRDTASDKINYLLTLPEITSITGTVTVSAASFNLYQIGYSSWDSEDFEVRRLLVSYVESEATNLIRSTGNSWTSDGATSDGNDRETSVSATGSSNGTNGEYKTYTGSTLTSNIEDEINGDLTHYGYVFENNTGFTGYRVIQTTEGTDTQRPYLSVTYTAAAGASYDGILKRWNGSAWVKAKMQRYNGSDWVDTGFKYYDGSWKTVDTTGA